MDRYWNKKQANFFKRSSKSDHRRFYFKEMFFQNRPKGHLISRQLLKENLPQKTLKITQFGRTGLVESTPSNSRKELVDVGQEIRRIIISASVLFRIKINFSRISAFGQMWRNFNFFFLKMGHSRPLFVYLCLFRMTQFNKSM